MMQKLMADNCNPNKPKGYIAIGVICRIIFPLPLHLSQGGVKGILLKEKFQTILLRDFRAIHNCSPEL